MRLPFGEADQGILRHAPDARSSLPPAPAAVNETAPSAAARGGRWQRLLLAVSRSPMIDSGDVLGASVLICDAVAQGLEVERASVWMLAPNRRSMQCIALVDHADPSASNNISLGEDDYPAYFAALAEQRSLAIDDARSDPRTREFVDGYLLPLGIHALLDTPIRQHGDTVGIICA
jgi:two-component system, NtrC family, sensor kinase